MRYKESGNVHMDFHRTLNATISYLVEKHGEAFLKKTLRRMAHDVYHSIREDLRRGDPAQLLEHWCYYFDREKGKYEIKHTEDEIRMTVTRCPAFDYLEKQGIEISPHFCSQTVEINKALAEDTPFRIQTRPNGDGSCVQIIEKRDKR